MITVRKLIPALCLATSLSGLAVYAATTTTPTTTGTPSWHHGHHGGFGPIGLVLHQLNKTPGLNLTPDQKTQIKGVFAGEKSQFQALAASAKANRQALATTPPTDTSYPGLIQTAQTNAAARIKLESDVWTGVYGYLTQAQRDAIPGIIAAAKAQREAKFAAWKAQHPQAPAPESN